jgi:hypothetical protein
MKILRILAITAALGCLLDINAADNKRKNREESRSERRELKGDIGDRVRDINKLDNNQAAKLAGLRAVSQETAVPVPKLQDQLKEHPKAGIAGLLVANEIAVRTKKEANDILKTHANGRPWSEIAQNNNESLEGLEAKLGRVEQSMRNAK